MTNTGTAKCVRCGRALSSAASVDRGMGRHCARRVKMAIAAVVVSGVRPGQAAKALELIEDVAILPLRRRIYLAVSSDGAETYRCDASHCTCPAGVRGRGCYHELAVRLLAA